MTTLPHFSGALGLETTPGKGLCFHRSAGLVLDVPHAMLVIGTIRAATPEEQARMPNASLADFIHAWVELFGAVLAPTTYEAAGNRLVPFERANYYEANGIADPVRLKRRWVQRVSARHGLDRHLRHHAPLPDGVSFGKTILDAAGVKYQTRDGVILPPETK